MIYLVNYTHADFSTITVSEAIEALNSLPDNLIYGDSESTGFYPVNSELLFFQLGNADNQYIIFKEDLIHFKELLETKTLVFHGAKHDLKFLYAYNIFPHDVIDTHLQELILESGKHKLGIALKNASLASVTKKYLGIILDKSQRKKLNLDKESFIYGAKDVEYLPKILEIQRKRIENHNFSTTAVLDNNFVKVLAYTENPGFKLNVEGWKEKCAQDQIKHQECYKNLIEAVEKDERTEDYINIVSDLFSAPTKQLAVNLDSPKEVIPFLKSLGINLTLKGKETVEGKNLKKYADKEPILALYLEYKALSKKLSTYGKNILDIVETFPDQRLRTDFKQIITTGRMSSGAEGESGTGVNLQNLPKLSIERKYFTCEKGNKLIISDFTGQETRILAEFAKDPVYTDFITNKEKDLHCFLLQCIDPEKYNQYTHNEIKKKFPHERTWVKPGTFSMPYGGDGNTIANNLGISEELGKAAYDRFMNAFPGLINYYNRVEKHSLLNGFIYCNDFSKRKIFLTNYDQYKLLASKKYLDKEDFKLKMRYESKIKRLARNYPIQASGSDMLKLSGLFLFTWLRKNNFLNIIKIVGFIHDEIILEAPEELAKKAEQALNNCMIKAGKIICPNIPIYTESRISDIWLEEKE